MRAMTAYAYVVRRKKNIFLETTLRSLNSKYLEISIYGLPPEKLFLEEEIKRLVKKKIVRGRVEIYLSFRTPWEEKVFINEALLRDYLSQFQRISQRLGFPQEEKIYLQDLVALPGVIQVREKRGLAKKVLLEIVKEGLDRLIKFKEKQGKIVKKEIVKNFTNLRVNIDAVRKLIPPGEELNRENIDEEVALICFYLTKLERIIHLRKTYPKGKEMDFLSQEILRELNTASAKTKQIKLASLIVECKNYLERIREQIQNIE